MDLLTPKRRWIAAGVTALLATGAVTAGAGVAGADGNTPPGNNGHIQIDEFLMDGGNGNDPHVPCGFSVSFFGYDAGTQQASIDITPSAPTEGGTPFTVAATWQTTTRTGGNQLDLNVPIDPAKLAGALQGIVPAHEGVHIRVDVTVTGSQGADAKHKMFWVQPCLATPQQVAADSAAVTAINGGATPADATTTAAAAAVGAGATAELAKVLGVQAVEKAVAAQALAIPAAAPAVPLAVAANTTG